MSNPTSTTPAAAQAALLHTLQAFIGARESLDIAQQMHLQLVCDPDSGPDERQLADSKLTEFERAEELALAALIGAYRGWLAANEVREIQLDGQRIDITNVEGTAELAPQPAPGGLAFDQNGVLRQAASGTAASLKHRFSAFLNGGR